MKMHHLRDLLAIVERGSIRAAARHLGIAQPALSRSIRELEKEIGVPLFERRAKGSFLTPMGHIFARRANTAFTELRRAHEEIQQLQGQVHGTVIAGISSLALVSLMPSVWTPFRKRYPQIQLQVIESVYPVIESRLKEGVVDLYVGPAPANGPAPGLQMDKLFDNTRAIFARKGHPLANATSLAQLIDADWVTTSITDKAEMEFNDVFVSQGLAAPRLALSCQTALTWISAVAESDFLALNARQWAHVPLAKTVLQMIEVKEIIAGPSIVIMQRAEIPLTPAAEYLGDLVRRAAVPFTR